METESQHIYSAEKSDRLDSTFRRYIQNPFKILNKHVNAGMTVLDLGCGTGYFTIPLSNLVGPSGSVIAVDCQKEMLLKLKAKIKNNISLQNIMLYQNFPESLGKISNLDFVMAAYVFHELPNQLTYLKEIHKSLNNQGKLLIMEPKVIVSEKSFTKTLNYTKELDYDLMEYKTGLFSRSILLRKRS